MLEAKLEMPKGISLEGVLDINLAHNNSCYVLGVFYGFSTPIISLSSLPLHCRGDQWLSDANLDTLAYAAELCRALPMLMLMMAHWEFGG